MGKTLTKVKRSWRVAVGRRGGRGEEEEWRERNRLQLQMLASRGQGWEGSKKHQKVLLSQCITWSFRILVTEECTVPRIKVQWRAGLRQKWAGYARVRREQAPREPWVPVTKDLHLLDKPLRIPRYLCVYKCLTV